MHHTFENSLAVKMCQILNQVDLLKKNRATLSGRERVLVICNRNTLICCQGFSPLLPTYSTLRRGDNKHLVDYHKG